jgi:hypothetical protein
MAKTTQKTTLYLPLALHAAIHDAAERAGHSMNDEILARLASAEGPVTLRDVYRQNEHTQTMVQQIIDAISPRR